MGVTRINLAVKEVDVQFGQIRISANRSFAVAIWSPSHLYRGFVPMNAEGKPVQNSPDWHDYEFADWRLRSLVLRTVGLPWVDVNAFPFERYETEVIFGFNVTGISARDATLSPWLSADLSEQGKWNVTAHFENVTQPLLKLPGQKTYIETKGIVSFFSLIIQLAHPSAYSLKMTIPTWGPLVFLLTLFMIQFRFVRRQLQRKDHVSMFIGATVFALGQAMLMRDVTPPELTLAELATFAFTMLYVGALALVISQGGRKMATKTKTDVLIVIAGLLVAIFGLIVSGDFVKPWVGYYSPGLGYAFFDLGLGALVVYVIVETIVERSRAREWKQTLANHFDRLGNGLATVYLTIAPIAERFDTLTMQELEDHQRYLEWGKRELNGTYNQFREVFPTDVSVIMFDCISGLTELIDLLAETRKMGAAEYGRMITFRSKSLELQDKMCTLFDKIGEYAPYWKSDIFRKRLESYRDWYQKNGSDRGKAVLTP